jgi:hypothetical protein
MLEDFKIALKAREVSVEFVGIDGDDLRGVTLVIMSGRDMTLRVKLCRYADTENWIQSR